MAGIFDQQSMLAWEHRLEMSMEARASKTAGPFNFAALTSDALALIDRCILPAQVDDRHRFAAPHAMEVVPGVGHFLHIDAPEAIAERITAWAK